MRYVKISDVFNLQMGKTPSRKKPEYWNEGKYDWVSIADLGSYSKYVGKTKERISEAGVIESGIKAAPANTVIMSFKLSLGKTAITTKETYTNEAIMAFIDKGTYEVCPDFIFHQFRTKNWTADTNQAVMGATLNKKTLSSCLMYLPSIEKQALIASRLNYVRDLIEKAMLQYRKYDDLVKSQFIEMFGTVDDNKFGYRVIPLSDIAEKIFAGGDKPNDVSEIADDVYRYPVYANGIDREGLQCYSKEFKVSKPAVTVSARGTIGYTFVRMEPFTPVVRLITIIPKSFVDVLYLKYALDSTSINGTGTSQAQVTVPVFKKKTIIVPPIELQNKFTQIVDQAEKSKFRAQQMVDRLQELYDSLTQEYFGLGHE